MTTEEQKVLDRVLYYKRVEGPLSNGIVVHLVRRPSEVQNFHFFTITEQFYASGCTTIEQAIKFICNNSKPLNS